MAAAQGAKLKGQRTPIRGRPPRELAGEVDERIIDAASRLFLKNGVSGTSVEDIAKLAQASKQTIYAKFRNKEVLFMEVALYLAGHNKGGFGVQSAPGKTISERLRHLGIDILKRVLTPEHIAYLRLMISESDRFPSLAQTTRFTHDITIGLVKSVLEDIAREDSEGRYVALKPEHIERSTYVFLDILIQGMQRRALYGESLNKLLNDADDHVAAIVPYFLAACENLQHGHDAADA